MTVTTTINLMFISLMAFRVVLCFLCGRKRESVCACGLCNVHKSQLRPRESETFTRILLSIIGRTCCGDERNLRTERSWLDNGILGEISGLSGSTLLFVGTSISYAVFKLLKLNLLSVAKNYHTFFLHKIEALPRSFLKMCRKFFF